MGFKEDEYLQLSGLQHFAFCRRQWALIHVEQLWRDNLRTVEGEILHERAHDETLRERSRDKITMRGLRIASSALGISGACDVVEFVRSRSGARLTGEDGLWQPYPVEYKRGSSKISDADRLQLCAQAMCLEEMLGCAVPDGWRSFLWRNAQERTRCVGRGAPSTGPRNACRDACVLQEGLYSEGQDRETLQRLLTEGALSAGAVPDKLGACLYSKPYWGG